MRLFSLSEPHREGKAAGYTLRPYRPFQPVFIFIFRKKEKTSFFLFLFSLLSSEHIGLFELSYPSAHPLDQTHSFGHLLAKVVLDVLLLVIVRSDFDQPLRFYVDDLAHILLGCQHELEVADPARLFLGLVTERGGEGGNKAKR